MLETERSADEALRQPTFRRLYLGACKIENETRKLRACFIILLAGRVGLRTGEIQHVCEEWIDWERGEIAIPRHHPCGCGNCWIRAIEKADRERESNREGIEEYVKNNMDSVADDDVSEFVDRLLEDDETIPEEIDLDRPLDEIIRERNEDEQDGGGDTRTAEEILYEDRWQPKYQRSARRVPFGHSLRLTAAIHRFLKDEGHLDITQTSMLNHVREAADHAEGVDPENITIRGLRATAATHYATYIRNPKVLQDLMGWTRIETAARYLRRAGATTTDILYSVFGGGSLRPTMFAGDPESRFPLINDPRKYDGEPFEPMLWRKVNRMAAGREHFPGQIRVLHPREPNPPDDIVYDQSNHELSVHADFESDIIDRGQLDKPVQATLSDAWEQHPRKEQFEEKLEADEEMRVDEDEEAFEERMENKRETSEFSESLIENSESPITIGSPFVKKFFRVVDQVADWLPEMMTRSTSRTVHLVKGSLGYVLLGAMYAWMLFQIDILAPQSTPPYFFVESVRDLGIMVVFASYVMYKLPEADSVIDLFR